jgi:hypothetical protein
LRLRLAPEARVQHSSSSRDAGTIRLRPTAKYGETCRETLFICVQMLLPTSHAVSPSEYRRNYRRETYT